MDAGLFEFWLSHPANTLARVGRRREFAYEIRNQSAAMVCFL